MKPSRRRWLEVVVILCVVSLVVMLGRSLLAAPVGPSSEEVIRLKRGGLVRHLVYMAWTYSSENAGQWPLRSQWEDLLEADPPPYSLSEFGPVFFLRPLDELPPGGWEQTPAFFVEPATDAEEFVVALWGGSTRYLDTEAFKKLVDTEQAERLGD